MQVDERGRVVLPAALRSRMGIRPGDELVVNEESDGAVRLSSRTTAAKSLIGLAGTADHSTIEELRAQRRRDAASEGAD